MIHRLFASLGVAILLVGCNTIAGVGKDIERGGEAIQRAVR